jgi:hypothetical protein
MPGTPIDVKDANGVTQTINTIPNPGQAANAASQPVTLSTEQAGLLTSMVNSLVALVETLGLKQALSFYPGFTQSPIGELRGMSFDEFGALYMRGGVTTDEGSFRLNFAGASLSRALPGTPTFTNLSRTVTGAGFLAMEPPLLVGDYVKLNADAESAWARVYSIDTDGQLTLDAEYTGTGGTGPSSTAGLKTSTGAGMSVAVAAGNKTITCGTTAAVTTSVLREVDYGPLIYQTGFSISQRIANQDIYRGFTAPNGLRRYFAHFHFTGTTATQVLCETGWALTAPASGTDVQTTTVTLPNGLTTATLADYRIELRGEVVSFYVNEVEVARHKAILPKPYDILAVGSVVINGTTPASSTVITVTYECCNNIDSLRMSIANQTDNVIANPQPAQTFTYNVAGIIAINTDLLIIDCAQIAELSIHCQSMGTTGVVTAAWSNTPDFAGATTATLYSETGASSTTFNAAVLRKTNRQARYLRLRLTTATTAGTTTIVVTGYPTPSAPVVATQPVSGTVTANIGTGSLAAGTNTIGAVRLAADSGQGASTTHRQALVANITTGAPTSVKASAGTVNAAHVANNSGVGVWVHFYNKASAPTLGTDTPVASVFVKAGDTIPLNTGGFGDRFSTGIAYAVCDNCAAIPTAGGTITIAGTANAICVSLFYT